MKTPPKRDLIAYEGPAFTIEWYWTALGRSPAREYFEALSEDRQDDLLMLLKRMGDLGRIFDKTKFRNEGDQIFAFKPQPDRYLCFFTAGGKIIITNAFVKKSDKLPATEKQRALRAKADFEARVEKELIMKANKTVSTFDRIMKDPKRRRRFDRKYRSFVLSEIIHGLMEQEKKSVRELAREVGISPTVIQDIRSGGRTNVTLRSFLGIVSALGGKVAVQKGNEEMVLEQ
jgi:hypothetical protein